MNKCKWSRTINGKIVLKIEEENVCSRKLFVYPLKNSEALKRHGLIFFDPFLKSRSFKKDTLYSENCDKNCVVLGILYMFC